MGIKSRLIPWEGELRRVVEEAELVVNATPLGMAPDSGQSPVAGEWLRPDQFVYDLVFNPDPSRLVREARGRGCRALGGLEMLVRQGALSFRLWTGVEPPLEVMAAAARAGLEGNVGGR
jgi:shikimate dehydrogenase